MLNNMREYWPFSLSEGEKEDPEMINGVNFLEAATKAGFRGYRSGTTDFGAESSTRNGLIVWRITGKRWQIMLSCNSKRCLDAYVSNYSKAADAILHWLQGASTVKVLDEIEDILAAMGTNQKRYKLYDD